MVLKMYDKKIDIVKYFCYLGIETNNKELSIMPLTYYILKHLTTYKHEREFQLLQRCPS